MLKHVVVASISVALLFAGVSPAAAQPAVDVQVTPGTVGVGAGTGRPVPAAPRVQVPTQPLPQGVPSPTQLACGSGPDECFHSLATDHSANAAVVATAVARAVTAVQVEPPPMCFAPGTAESGAVGLVGLQGWAWICPEQVRESTVGPVHRVVPAGPIVITMTAINTAVALTWGDGSLPTVCPGPLLPFTPFTDAAAVLPIPGGPPSPTCGHFIGKSSITMPNKVFRVTATSMWIIFWTAVTPEGAVSGAVPMPMTSDYRQRIGEVQVLGGN